MGGSEKLAVHHGFPESGTASARGTANSQGARPAATRALSLLLLLLLLLLLHCTPNDVSERFETTGAFPSMFFTCPNFFQKNFLFRYPKIANFDRPKRGHINEFLNSFFEMT